MLLVAARTRASLLDSIGGITNPENAFLIARGDLDLADQKSAVFTAAKKSGACEEFFCDGERVQYLSKGMCQTERTQLGTGMQISSMHSLLTVERVWEDISFIQREPSRFSDFLAAVEKGHTRELL
jgi:hypothetical protein